MTNNTNTKQVKDLKPGDLVDLYGDKFADPRRDQHGSADPFHVMHVTRPATPEEYADLKSELESAPYGYRLKVYSRTVRQFGEARLKEYAEMSR